MGSGQPSATLSGEMSLFEQYMMRTTIDALLYQTLLLIKDLLVVVVLPQLVTSLSNNTASISRTYMHHSVCGI